MHRRDGVTHFAGAVGNWIRESTRIRESNVIAGLVLLTALIAGSFSGCGSGTVSDGSRVDGGDAAANRRDANNDLDPMVIYREHDCSNARFICDENANVRRCLGGQPAEVVESCSGACSLGRCTTRSCADVEHGDGLRGCQFYGAQMDNIDSDDSKKVMLLASNNSGAVVSAWVEVPVPGAAGEWIEIARAILSPGQGARLQLNRPVTSPGLTPGGAFRVQSDGPVTVLEVASDDSDRSSLSTSGTMLRPLQALGTRHFAVTNPAYVTDGVLTSVGSREGAAAITVVATQPGTHVRLRSKAALLIGPGERLEATDAESYEAAPMEEGDVLQVFSAGPDADLSGTSVTSDVPVAVFSGNVFTTYGYELIGRRGGDAAQEQLPPIGTWGQTYIGAYLAPQRGCDPFFGPGVGHWRAVASRDVDVSIQPFPGVAIQAANLDADLTGHLREGEVMSFVAFSAVTPLVPSDFLFRATGPVLLAQSLDCEPGLSWGLDDRLSSGAVVLKLPAGFEHELVVVRKAGTQVTLDGAPMLSTWFSSVGPRKGEQEIARVPSTALGPCQDALDACEHVIAGQAFGVSWQGTDVVCSYATSLSSTDPCTLPYVSSCI